MSARMDTTGWTDPAGSTVARLLVATPATTVYRLAIARPATTGTGDWVSALSTVQEWPTLLRRT